MTRIWMMMFFAPILVCGSPSNFTTSSSPGPNLSTILSSGPIPAQNCSDTSEFCQFTKHLCEIRSDFATMKSRCAKTCGFCGLETFDDFLAKNCEQQPRKCVWPRKNIDFLGTTGAPEKEEVVSGTRITLPRGFSARSFAGNLTTETPTSRSSPVQTQKIKLEELLVSSSTIDTLPRIATAEPSQLTTSMTKTVIQGQCFDEYIYCREFISLCSHPAFSDVMASHCSLTCQRCDEIETTEIGSDDCHDSTDHCSGYTDLCHDETYAPLMQKHCSKSCGFCVSTCRDRHLNCPQFKTDGFCHDEMYTDAEITYLCGDTCQMC